MFILYSYSIYVPEQYLREKIRLQHRIGLSAFDTAIVVGVRIDPLISVHVVDYVPAPLGMMTSAHRCVLTQALIEITFTT